MFELLKFHLETAASQLLNHKPWSVTMGIVLILLNQT